MTRASVRTSSTQRRMKSLACGLTACVGSASTTRKSSSSDHDRISSGASESSHARCIPVNPRRTARAFTPDAVQVLDGASAWDLGDPVSHHESGDDPWVGKMVLSGCVTLEIRSESTGQTFTADGEDGEACVTVEDRPRTTEADPIPERMTAWGQQPAPGATGLLVGRNVEPNGGVDVELHGTHDFSAPIGDNGPKHGYVYLDSVSYRVSREWELNQHLRQNGPAFDTSSVAQRHNHWSWLLAHSLDPTLIRDGIERHETFGTGSTLNGHQRELMTALADPTNPNSDECGNVNQLMERLAGSSALVSPRATDVREAAEEYLNRAIDGNTPFDFEHRRVGGNYSGVPIVVWTNLPDTAQLFLPSDQTPTGSSEPAIADCTIRYLHGPVPGGEE